MIKVSRLADYAVVILARMIANEADLISGAQLSRESSLPEPTVAKVLKLLNKAEILTSTRGVSGGYRLNRSAVDIGIVEVIMAVDGPIALTACVEGSTSDCDYSCSCPVKGRWNPVNDAVIGALKGITLADVLRDDFVASEGTKKYGHI